MKSNHNWRKVITNHVVTSTHFIIQIKISLRAESVIDAESVTGPLLNFLRDYFGLIFLSPLFRFPSPRSLSRI